MTISEELQALYASGGGVYMDVLSFFHPEFSEDWHLTPAPHIADTPVPFFAFAATVRGALVNVVSHPLAFELPPITPGGRQDLDVTLANTGPAMVAELKAAAAVPQTPIEVEHNVFIPGSTVAQRDRFVMKCRGVPTSGSVITLRANLANLPNMSFPRRYYTTTDHPGLRR